MLPDNQLISDILYKYCSNEPLTDQEQSDLNNWLNASQENRNVLLKLKDSARLQSDLKIWSAIHHEAEEAWVKFSNDSNEGKKDRYLDRIHFLRTAWFKISASVLIIAGIGAYLWTNNFQHQPATTLVAASDVAAPETSLATITLSNGKRIALDSSENGMLAQEGNVQIQKMEGGQIIYKGVDEGKMLYNTFTVPRGSKIASLTLSDGTVVFLNCESSLRYPVAFTDNERKVEIYGEAYFEVAKDSKRKFLVKSGNLTTEVLGTHFNINNYQDEGVIKVTLLEGSIKTSNGLSSMILTHGNQVSSEGNSMKLEKSVNIEQVMSWKDGVFNFSDMSFKSAMLQVSRWYDVDVVYPDDIPLISFGGKIPKTISLSEMLEALGAVGVKFKIDGKKITILP